MIIESSINIKAPISTVFNAFADLAFIEKNITGITNLKLLEGKKKMAVGTKWEETRVMFGKEAKETMWVTDLQKNKTYVVEAESHGTHYTSTYTFTETEDGTNVDLTFEGKPLTIGSRIMSIMFFFAKGSTKKAFEKDMQEIKNILER